MVWPFCSEDFIELLLILSMYLPKVDLLSFVVFNECKLIFSPLISLNNKVLQIGKVKFYGKNIIVGSIPACGEICLCIGLSLKKINLSLDYVIR